MVAARVPIPEGFNAAQYFLDSHRRGGSGESLAILFEDQRLTYKQVADYVNRFANVLSRHDVALEERVALLLFDSPAFVASFWGTIKRGAVALPLNTLLSAEEYEFILRDSRARALVIEADLLPKVAPALVHQPQLKTVLVAGRTDDGYENWEDEMARSSTEFQAVVTHRDDPAFWLYTSGSTGQPKAAVHLHHDMVYCLELYAKQILQITSQDRTFSASKLFFAYGLGNALYFPFGVGASTVLLRERATPEKVFQIIDRYKPTLFFGVPTLYAGMLQIPEAETRYDLSSVRCAVSAGEALPAALWEKFRDRFGIEILDGIGSTEMLHIFISNRPNDVVPGSSGKLVPGYDAKITDEQGREVGANEIGNLWVHGESGASGYWNRPERTQATFVGEWMMTGDKYTRDEKGYFWHCGRSDDMLKVSGLWVSPVEIESALLARPEVAECAVVGATDRDGLTKPKAFVVLDQAAVDKERTQAELQEFLKGRLPSYKVPRWITVVDTLPKTATGKIQRFKLREA